MFFRNISRNQMIQSAAALCLSLLLALLASGLIAHPIHAQSTPADCGVVDAIMFPVDDMGTRGDDFGIYRGRFGGLHVGVDVAFYQYGDPVRAIARGRVTYADPAGWDSEKGVVIIEHTFPDGSVFYSLYGHMEPAGDYFFPGVGQCVAMGDIVGAVGQPTLSAPHLHFEIRDFNPDDGGPGYWDTNPLEAGWQHPVDFIQRWDLVLTVVPDATEQVTLTTSVNPSAVPPAVLSDGGLVIAHSNLLEGVGPDGGLRWRMELANTITGVMGLAGDAVLVHTSDNTVFTIQDGRYTGMWQPDVTLTGAPMAVDGAAVFLTADNALRAYAPDGTLLWGTPPLGDRVGSIAIDGDRIAVGTRPRAADLAPAWHVVGGGAMLYQVAPANPPFATFGPDGAAYLLDGPTLYRISPDFVPTPLARLPYSPGNSTALAADAQGNSYVFMALDESVIYAYDADGNPRWEAILPGTHRQPPLLAAGQDCLLYALAADGTLYAIHTADGAILGQAQLYAGGAKGSPNARLLDVQSGSDGGEIVRFGAGFLTIAALDGYTLAGLPPATCPAE
jgi:hypothetical protein